MGGWKRRGMRSPGALSPLPCVERALRTMFSSVCRGTEVVNLPTSALRAFFMSSMVRSTVFLSSAFFSPSPRFCSSGLVLISAKNLAFSSVSRMCLSMYSSSAGTCRGHRRLGAQNEERGWGHAPRGKGMQLCTVGVPQSCSTSRMHRHSSARTQHQRPAADGRREAFQEEKGSWKQRSLSIQDRLVNHKRAFLPCTNSAPLSVPSCPLPARAGCWQYALRLEARLRQPPCGLPPP